MHALSWSRPILARFRRLNHRHVLADAVLIVFSLYLSLYLRLGDTEFFEFFGVMNQHVVLFLGIRIATFAALGVYDIIWRYVSVNDAARLVRGVLLSSVFIVASSYIVDIGRLPRAVFFIDAVNVTLLLSGLRFLRRLVYERAPGRLVRKSGVPAIVVGAGTNGRAIVSRFATDSTLGLNVIGFIDDNPQKVGRLIGGIKVLGSSEDLEGVIRHFGVREVILGIRNPPGSLLHDIVQTCRAHNIRPRRIAGGLGSRDENNTVRDIELNDLLNRPKRPVSTDKLKELVAGKRVLITGAGGSIGSELARQVYRLDPEALLLLDHSELNLYGIDRELRQSAEKKGGAVVPLLVDIKESATLRGVFEQHRPELVFHAAAYKHVHLVEHNFASGILNNVIGTRNTLQASVRHGVETFVLISTDKAVNPVGVMGATKRLCELMVTETGLRENRRYCSVRFGNVLGSSGSLIPLLEKQIREGEPLTITHPDMTRYFMLIPEAVSLVVKAATIASPGDITLLRMGEPVRIVDVATSLRALMGKSEEENPILFTGLRPGEKIHEELYTCGNELQTSHPDILIVPKGDQVTAGTSVMESLERLELLARSGASESVSHLWELIGRMPPEPPTSRPPQTPEVRVWQ